MTPVTTGCSLGRTPSASNPPAAPLTESSVGSKGDICSGHAADAEEADRKLDEGLSWLLGEGYEVKGKKIMIVNSVNQAEYASEHSSQKPGNFNYYFLGCLVTALRFYL